MRRSTNQLLHVFLFRLSKIGNDKWGNFIVACYAATRFYWGQFHDSMGIPLCFSVVFSTKVRMVVVSSSCYLSYPVIHIKKATSCQWPNSELAGKYLTLLWVSPFPEVWSKGSTLNSGFQDPFPSATVPGWVRDGRACHSITLLRVVPTMTSIRFVTGKSSGILSDISSGILSGESSGILSGISSGILPGISSAICSGISSGTLSGISSGISSDILCGILSGKSSGQQSGTLSGIRSGNLSDILSGIPSGISSGILSGISSGILPGISSGILPGISYGILPGISSGILPGISYGTLSGISSGISSDILSGILSGKSSGICSGKNSGTLSGIRSGILSDILSGVLSGISSGILSGRWGPAVLTELGGSQEVQRCPVRSDPCSWGPAVPTACGSWRRAWRRVGKAEVNIGVDAKVAEEKLEGGEEGGGGWGAGGGGGEQLWSNLTTLTWQVGKKQSCDKWPIQ